MTEQRVSSRYARAIFTAAAKDDLIETVLNDFRFINSTIESSRDLKNLVNSPIVQFWKKAGIFKEIFEGKIHKVSMSCLMLIAEKRRESLMPSIEFEYELLYNKLHNIQPVSIGSAIELSDEIKERLVNKLKDITDMNILARFFVDKELKGGLKVTVKDWVYDASIRNKLDLLYGMLAGS